MDTCKIVKFIETTLLRRGEGVPEDPVRIITQYWDLEGNLVFELDPCGVKKVKYFKLNLTH